MTSHFKMVDPFGRCIQQKGLNGILTYPELSQVSLSSMEVDLRFPCSMSNIIWPVFDNSEYNLLKSRLAFKVPWSSSERGLPSWYFGSMVDDDGIFRSLVTASAFEGTSLTWRCEMFLKSIQPGALHKPDWLTLFKSDFASNISLLHSFSKLFSMNTKIVTRDSAGPWSLGCVPPPR